MSDLTAPDYFVQRPPWPEARAAHDRNRDVAAERPGGGAPVTLTIDSGAIEPQPRAARHVLVETEAAAAADDLTHVTAANVPDGAWLLLSAADSSRVPTLVDSAGGAGEVVTDDGEDLVLDSVRKRVLLRWDAAASSWREVLRVGFDVLAVEAVTAAGPTDVLASESGKGFTNAGAAGGVGFDLPAAVRGLHYVFAAVAAQVVTVNVQAGETVGDHSGVSSAGGSIASSGAAREVLEVACFEDGEWQVTRKGGTWTTS